MTTKHRMQVVIVRASVPQNQLIRIVTHCCMPILVVPRNVGSCKVRRPIVLPSMRWWVILPPQQRRHRGIRIQRRRRRFTIRPCLIRIDRPCNINNKSIWPWRPRRQVRRHQPQHLPILLARVVSIWQENWPRVSGDKRFYHPTIPGRPGPRTFTMSPPLRDRRSGIRHYRICYKQYVPVAPIRRHHPYHHHHHRSFSI